MAGQLFSTIRTKYNTLSTSQKVVADYVLANPEKVMLNTLSEIADICGVSETTVLRFLHKIDFKSYQLFRINLTQELSSSDAVSTTYEDVKFGDSIETIIEKVVLSTSSAIQDTRELVDYNIRVNAIMPGYIRTPLIDTMALDACPEDPESVVNSIAGAIPMGRMGKIEELGELAAFLACEESSYITGQGIVIDGGSTLPETATMGV